MGHTSPMAYIGIRRLLWRYVVLVHTTATQLVVVAPGCGGKAAQGDGLSAPGGSAGSGGTVQEPSSCVEPPAAPVIDYQPTCSTFIPALAPTEVTFVDQTADAGTGLVGHRFRSTEDCGFDVVISLPRLKFAADEQTYEMSTWWLSSMGLTELVTVILRRSGDRALLLGVAASGSTYGFNALASPLAVTQNGPVCADSAESGVNEQVVELDGVALPCENETATPWLRVCRDGGTQYRMVDFPAPLDSTTAPAVLGAAELLRVTN
jgi:hypothetical protein